MILLRWLVLDVVRYADAGLGHRVKHALNRYKVQTAAVAPATARLQAYHDIATAAIKQVHTAAAADIAWLLRTVTQPAILPLLPHPLMDALLQNAADAYMALLSAAAPTVVADPANRRWGAGMHYRDDLQTDYDPGQMGNRAGSGRRSSYTRYSNEPKVSGAAGAVPEPVAQIARILEAFSNAGAQHEMLLESCAAAATRVAGAYMQ